MSLKKEVKLEEELSIDQKMITNLLFTGNWINEKSTDFFKKYDLSIQQYNVLVILKEKDNEPANLGEIQERMTSPMSNTTRLIDKLQNKELLTKVRCEENRRKVEIRISKNGTLLLEKINKEISSHGGSGVIGNLTGNEANLLNDLLKKLRNKN